jgi:Flp pilus assembly protein TadB
MALRAPVAPTSQVDLLIGFTGFFCAVFFVITVACELTGTPALTWALILLALVAVFWVLVRKRARILRHAHEADPRLDEGV